LPSRHLVVLGRPFLSVALCVLGSACIELAQQRYLPSRVPSLADIQHNSLGGLLGALLAWPVARPPFGRRQYAVADAKQPKVA
jgi:VanZ family protein